MIAHILRSIQLTGLSFDYFGPDLNMSLLRRRFGGMSAEDALDLEKIGGALLDADYSKPVSSGLFDRNGVILPLRDCLENAVKLETRLQFMLHFERKKHSLLTRAINDQVPNSPSKMSLRLNLKHLAIEIVTFAEDYASLIEPLLTGRLDMLSGVIILPAKARERWFWIERRMKIIWTLFDLQVIARKLNSAEWYVLDQSEPQLTTVASAHQIVNKLWRMANLAKDDFEAGRFGPDLHPALIAFCDEHGIREMGAVNADRLITTGKIRSEDTPPSLHDYLEKLAGVAAGIMAGFEKSAVKKSYTAVGYVRLAGKQKVKVRSGQPPKKAERSLEYKRKAATERFSVTTVTALCLAVCIAVEEITEMPGQPECDKQRSKAAPADVLTQQKNAFIKILFGIYRVHFVQDARSAEGLKAQYAGCGKPVAQAVFQDVGLDLDDYERIIACAPLPGSGLRLPPENAAEARLLLNAMKTKHRSSRLTASLAWVSGAFNHVEARRRSR